MVQEKLIFWGDEDKNYKILRRQILYSYEN